MASTFGKGCHLHLIDGSAYIFRAFHALPPLTRKSDGLPIGAVSGFCNMLHRYVEGNTGPDAPTHVAVVFDKGTHTFRNDLYDQYKANREAMPEDLRPQIPLTRQATEAFNIACKEIEGFEADVLDGLSRPLPALSVEYLPAAHDATLESLARIEALGRYVYRYSPVETMTWDTSAGDRWVDAAELRSLLDRRRPLGRSGDVYARHVPA